MRAGVAHPDGRLADHAGTFAELQVGGEVFAARSGPSVDHCGHGALPAGDLFQGFGHGFAAFGVDSVQLSVAVAFSDALEFRFAHAGDLANECANTGQAFGRQPAAVVAQIHDQAGRTFCLRLEHQLVNPSPNGWPKEIRDAQQVCAARDQTQRWRTCWQDFALHADFKRAARPFEEELERLSGRGEARDDLAVFDFVGGQGCAVRAGDAVAAFDACGLCGAAFNHIQHQAFARAFDLFGHQPDPQGARALPRSGGTGGLELRWRVVIAVRITQVLEHLLDHADGDRVIAGIAARFAGGTQFGLVLGGQCAWRAAREAVVVEIQKQGRLVEQILGGAGGSQIQSGQAREGQDQDRHSFHGSKLTPVF